MSINKNDKFYIIKLVKNLAKNDTKRYTIKVNSKEKNKGGNSWKN